MRRLAAYFVKAPARAHLAAAAASDVVLVPLTQIGYPARVIAVTLVFTGCMVLVGFLPNRITAAGTVASPLLCLTPFWYHLLNLAVILIPTGVVLTKLGMARERCSPSDGGSRDV
jgi:hypothetical protein